MDLSVVPLKRSNMISIDKNYGRRHETLFKKACDAYANFGGKYLLEDGSAGGDDLLKITIVQQFGTVTSMFTSHWDQSWPPSREEMQAFRYIEGPSDYAVQRRNGRDQSSEGSSDEQSNDHKKQTLVSDFVHQRPSKPISKKTGAPITRFGKTLDSHLLSHHRNGQLLSENSGIGNGIQTGTPTGIGNGTQICTPTAVMQSSHGTDFVASAAPATEDDDQATLSSIDFGLNDSPPRPQSIQGSPEITLTSTSPQRQAMSKFVDMASLARLDLSRTRSLSRCSSRSQDATMSRTSSPSHRITKRSRRERLSRPFFN